MARERKQQFLSKAQQALHRFLVPKTESNDWSNKNGMYGKLSIPALLIRTQSSRRDTPQYADEASHPLLATVHGTVP